MLSNSIFILYFSFIETFNIKTIKRCTIPPTGKGNIDKEHLKQQII
jgi:hypothetical protein